MLEVSDSKLEDYSNISHHDCIVLDYRNFSMDVALRPFDLPRIVKVALVISINRT